MQRILSTIKMLILARTRQWDQDDQQGFGTQHSETATPIS